MSPNARLLDRIAIASPCHVSWDSMTGDDRERHCAACDLDVYNLAAMTGAEAENLLRRKLGTGRLCAQIYRRADGTVLTADCPVGLRAARRLARGIGRVAAIFLLSAGSLGLTGCDRREILLRDSRARQLPVLGRILDWIDPPPPVQALGGKVAMRGDVVCPQAVPAK